MPDTSHLVAIHQRLINEKARLAAATTDQARALRSVWVRQAEKEYAGERIFLGMSPEEEIVMSDDELLAELCI